MILARRKNKQNPWMCRGTGWYKAKKPTCLQVKSARRSGYKRETQSLSVCPNPWVYHCVLVCLGATKISTMKILVLVLICLHLSEGVERYVWGLNLTVNFSPKGTSQARVEQRPSPADLVERQADPVLVPLTDNPGNQDLKWLDGWCASICVCVCVCKKVGWCFVSQEGRMYNIYNT